MEALLPSFLLRHTLANLASTLIASTLVRTGRVELPFPCGSQILSLVRLPIPPRSQWVTSTRDYNNPFSVPQILTARPISRNVAAFDASARLALSASGA